MQLDRLAKSGRYNIDVLREIHVASGVVGNKSLCYYLASLYLHLNEEQEAFDILTKCGGAHREMKHYCRVLMFCRRSHLPMPKLTLAEQSCLDYLDRVLNPDERTINQLIAQCGGFSIVGNAPGNTAVRRNQSSCKFYFNDYLKNHRVQDTATVHVVTPSWRSELADQSEHLCITGNDIFYRRSRVWRKFIKNRNFKAVYTLPQKLWSDLVVQLDGCSPSAGLLLLAYVSQQLSRKREMSGVDGYVAGFSFGQSIVNHSYDTEPASDNHNWVAESVLYKILIDTLSCQCDHFAIEP